MRNARKIVESVRTVLNLNAEPSIGILHSTLHQHSLTMYIKPVWILHMQAEARNIARHVSNVVRNDDGPSEPLQLMRLSCALAWRTLGTTGGGGGAPARKCADSWDGTQTIDLV